MTYRFVLYANVKRVNRLTLEQIHNNTYFTDASEFYVYDETVYMTDWSANRWDKLFEVMMFPGNGLKLHVPRAYTHYKSPEELYSTFWCRGDSPTVVTENAELRVAAEKARDELDKIIRDMQVGDWVSFV
jgi:hypothetical protein